jgi:hypothetical protein
MRGNGDILHKARGLAISEKGNGRPDPRKGFAVLFLGKIFVGFTASHAGAGNDIA